MQGLAMSGTGGGKTYCYFDAMVDLMLLGGLLLKAGSTDLQPNIGN